MMFSNAVLYNIVGGICRGIIRSFVLSVAICTNEDAVKKESCVADSTSNDAKKEVDCETERSSGAKMKEKL